ncbi:surface-adhesin E family protein [Novosphingobium olei]|uniref:surface-adhesin E family protein n=1 Tax=Novosphingobium olei TaxID=2728851 RepID=UPI00308C1184|nr:hypothetical protein NSDW_11970 [Novosphingobium olei]
MIKFPTQMLKRLPIAMAALASPVQAATVWVPVGTSSTGSRWYMDDRALGAGSGDYWFKIDYSNDRTEKDRSSVQLKRIDCSTRRSGTVQATTYAVNGVARSYGPITYPSLSVVVPDTIGEVFVDLICATPNKG